MDGNMRIVLIGLAVHLLGVAGVPADVFRIDSPDEWENWHIPHGVVEIKSDGGLELVKYRRQINAVADAGLFVHPSQKHGEVKGGIFRAGSNERDSERIIDGDLNTYWQPDSADQLIKWSIDIDLGRPVLARSIKLSFPDQEGARPFRQFSVFVTQGARIQAQDDVFRYRKVFETTQPNYADIIVIPLKGSEQDTTRILDYLPELDLQAEQDYQVVRLIRIVAHEQNSDAALAEVEVLAQGDNISLGTLERGGNFEHGLLAREPQNMFDGNMDTFGNILTSGGTKGGWKEGGLWWQVDLGALFWLDEIFIYFQNRGEGTSSFLFEGLHHGRGYNILYSDGRRTTGGELDLTFLLREDIAIDGRLVSERLVRHIRYLFRPRKIRYLFWHGHEDSGWFSHPMEFMIFSPGYPAQVVLRSDFIDLGKLRGDGRPKAIKELSWESETPDQTRLQVRSRAGNTLDEVYTFYDRKGAEITETKWTSLPKVLKGPIDTTLVAGRDWGPWSNFYQFSGEAFKSETPRRFIQLELILSTEDPRVAPGIGSLSIDFEDALIQSAKGRILPQQTMANEDTQFDYTIWPVGDINDTGFNRVRLFIPNAVEEGSLDIRVGGEEVEARGVSVEEDGLVVELPELVRTDSVQISFTTRILRNATVFDVELGHADRPGIWQSVEANERRANIVFLPELVDSDRLIGDLSILPRSFTPNGDGINDELEIRFALFKVSDQRPVVRIYDLAGRLVAELASSEGDEIVVLKWAGLDGKGMRVDPGIYLCQIDAQAEAGDGEVFKTISVVY